MRQVDFARHAAPSAYRCEKTDSITKAALYRFIEKHHPTLLLNELDTMFRGDHGEGIRGVLNSGFERGGKVIICVGDDAEPSLFSTFCPKVLSGIGRLPPPSNHGAYRSGWSARSRKRREN